MWPLLQYQVRIFAGVWIASGAALAMRPRPPHLPGSRIETMAGPQLADWLRGQHTIRSRAAHLFAMRLAITFSAGAADVAAEKSAGAGSPDGSGLDPITTKSTSARRRRRWESKRCRRNRGLNRQSGLLSSAACGCARQGNASRSVSAARREADPRAFRACYRYRRCDTPGAASAFTAWRRIIHLISGPLRGRSHGDAISAQPPRVQAQRKSS